MKTATDGRKVYIDQLRGIAMMMVVFGHTMTGCTVGSENSLLFNVIWSLQMPLFMLISGYVNRWSQPINNIKSFWNYIKKRTAAYMLPWIMWTFMIRGLVLQQNVFFDVSWLMNHMDSGYWFLFTLWIITLIHGTTLLLAEKCSESLFIKRYKCVCNKEIYKTLLTAIFFAFGMLLITLLGIVKGMSFLGIKLTLYYMPFYFVGYLFGKLLSKIEQKNEYSRLSGLFAALCCVVYFLIIIRFNLYTIYDDIKGILVRAAASMTGCVSLCALCKLPLEKVPNSGKLFAWIGRHSLEIYLIHGLLLSPMLMVEAPRFKEPVGMLLTMGNFILTMAMTMLIIQILNGNKYLKKFLFWK